jgi:hypothetical protein
MACGSPGAPVQLWNTAPGGAYLYTAEATVEFAGGEAVDAQATTIGLRSAIFSPTEGFVLNGLKVPMLGFSPSTPLTSSLSLCHRNSASAHAQHVSLLHP